MKKHNLFRKLSAIFLIFALTSSMLFTGCKKNDNGEDNKENDAKEESIDSKDAAKVQEEFDAYAKELFIMEMSEDYVSTRFSLENPEEYGIVFEEATWGEPVSIESIEEDYKLQKEILDKLDTFDYDLLTDEQKLTFDTIQKYIENSYAAKDYYLLEEVFSPMNGIQSQIPVIFSEFDFFDDEDIDDYIHLMETIDEYINPMLEFEKTRAKEGYFLTDTNADTVIEQCQSFIEGDENCLISIFEDKLEAYGITGDKKTEYVKRFETAINENLVPAYENIIETLSDLKGSRKTELGLSEFTDGKEYYELLVRDYTGSEKNVEELIEATEEDLSDTLSIVVNLIEQDPDIYDKFESFKYPTLEPQTAILLDIEKAEKYFPKTDEIPFVVKDVPESLESTMSPAFYLVPPIDNKDKNMIYINHSEEYESMNLFSTLAHEGVPGHMYQHYYFASTNPDPIRNVMHFGGYSEGWATYVEYYSYLFAGMNKKLASFTFANDRYSFALYSRIDMGIHYEGWDIEEVEYYLGVFGIYDEELVNELYYTLIDDPGVYLQYYIGCLEFLELKDKAEKKVEDFDEIEFHKFLLETGPTFFEIIDERMDAWIKEQND